MAEWYIPPLRLVFHGIVWNGPGPDIILTFDDGPHPVATPLVLDILRAEGITATFFLLGENVVAHRSIARRISDEGHVVGNHTFAHPRLWFRPRSFLADEIARAQSAIHDACGIVPSLFRPPYGRIDPSTAKHVRSEGLTTVMFGVNSWDYDLTQAPERIEEHVVRNARRGDIIVFHDNEKTAGRIETYLPRTIRRLRERGFTFGTLSPGEG